MAKTPPNKEAEIAAMRAAGWTVPAIAEHVGVSAATVKRICGRHKVSAGEDQIALVTAARKELSCLLSDDDRLRAIIGGLVIDTMAHISLGREKAAEALSHLNATDTKSAALVMRGLAAHATAVKAHADVLRGLLPAPAVDSNELPVLRIETLTAEEIAAMREEQYRESVALDGELDDTDEEGGGGNVVEAC